MELPNLKFFLLYVLNVPSGSSKENLSRIKKGIALHILDPFAKPANFMFPDPTGFVLATFFGLFWSAVEDKIFFVDLVF